MKYYVSYVLNRKNAKPHRFNHGFGNNNKEAYNSLYEIKKDILSMYHGYPAICETARKIKNWYIKDTKGELVLMGSVYKNYKGVYEIEWTR